MVKALDNSLVGLDIMPGTKQDGPEAGAQSGDQGYSTLRTYSETAFEGFVLLKDFFYLSGLIPFSRL